VDFFRQLLMMSPTERTQKLAGRTPESRAKILAKVREYLLLDPNERELRLRATELRWYLVPMMSTAPGDRTGQFARVPAELLPLVQSRLAQWDSLPAPLQQEFLAHDATLHYIAQPSAPVSTSAEADKVAEQFSQFFNLSDGEKQNLLGTLSGAERTQMEKTLQAFDQLPVKQRALCVRNFGKFAGMSPAERAEFMKNAERWSKMTPEERKTWRDLVAEVPMWPPAPAHLPPLPPPPSAFPQQVVPKAPKTNVATN
jgi:hypothetical protein